MKWIIVFFLLFISVLLESTITNLPIVLIVLFCSAIVVRNSGIFLWSFFGGIFLDALKLQTIGASSLFFLIFLAAAFLYERKFEVQSIPFIILFSFLGSMFYLWLFGSNDIFFQALLSTGIAVGLFWVWSQVNTKLA